MSALAARPADEFAAAGHVPLVGRVGDAVLFRNSNGVVTVTRFIADVARCADLLGDAGHVVNCCVDRYWFTVGFAAAVLRGQITLLTGDHAARGLAALAGRYGSVRVISDRRQGALPLPQDAIGWWDSDVTGAPVPVPEIPADRVAVIAFTSGSTGTPVGTAKTFAELAARSEAAAARFGFEAAGSATIIGTVPPHHMYGFETTILLPLHAPVASWRDPVFYPADLHAPLAVARGGAVLVTTPLQLRAMLDVVPAHPPAAVISATAPLDAALAAEIERRWNTRVLEIFGATEVGSIASRRTVVDAAWSVYPGVRLAGDPPMVSAPGAPARVLNDLIELGADGTSFRLMGRSGDIVKLGGRRASLAGLTRILTDMPGVQDGIFLAPDDLDTRPTARLLALAVAPTRSASDLLAALRDRIDPIFLPRPLLCVPQLPRNPLGKLSREALLALAAGAGPQ